MDGNSVLIIFTVISLICVCFTVFNLWKENNNLREDNKDLLNRLMAKTYPEYAAIEVKKQIIKLPEEKKQSLIVDQDIYQVN